MDGEAEGVTLARTVSRRLDLAGVGSNLLGAMVVFAFLWFTLPPTLDDAESERLLVRNAIAFAIYMAVTLPLGRAWVRRAQWGQIARWLAERRPARDDERDAVLRYPLGWVLRSGTFWVGAAVVFTALNSDQDPTLYIPAGVSILLGTLSACSLQYLVVERLMRPITARALEGGEPERQATPGVATRLTMAWLLATGVPLIGIAALAAGELAGGPIEKQELLVGTMFLALLAMAVGLAAMRFAAQAVADPLGSVRGALERIQRGEFDARTAVDDGSEIGLLQAGFNRMAAGLGERERLREAFGTFVDPGLTERVLEQGTDLAGEEVEVSVMFIDVRGFTSFAERSDARDVVTRLNELYELIVPLILRHGGHASKFIGDGLLAVFGAPDRLPDHAARAAAAALEVAEVVSSNGPGDLRVGIGVNTGRVVSGTIGGGGRLDFTVIGDPVNTAARVEAATRRTGDDVLITEATYAQLDGARGSWERRPPLELKGKSEPVALFAPSRD